MELDAFGILRQELINNLVIDGEAFRDVYVNYYPTKPEFITILPLHSSPAEITYGAGQNLLFRHACAMIARSPAYEDAYALIAESMRVVNDIRGDYRFFVEGTMPPVNVNTDFGDEVDYGCYVMCLGGI